MKKFFILLLYFNLIFSLFSTEPVTDVQKEFVFNSKSHSSLENQSVNETAGEFDKKNEKKEPLFPKKSISNIENNFTYPELEEIKEPEITTLEPEDFPTTKTNNEDSLKNKTVVDEELVIDDLPPIIEKSQNDTTKNTTNKNVESVKSDKNENSKKSQIPSKNKTEEKLENKNNKIPKAVSTNEKKTESPKSPNKQNSSPDNYFIEVKEDQVINIETFEQEKNKVLEAQKEEMEENKKSIVPSRTVTLKISEYLEVTYPGTGWIYMGPVDNSKNLLYFGRALGTENTTFSFHGRYDGTLVLHFYKNDYLTGDYIDDYLEVVILNEEGDNSTRILAPEYKQPVPKKKVVVEEVFKDSTSNESKESSFSNFENKGNEDINNQKNKTDNFVKDLDESSNNKQDKFSEKNNTTSKLQSPEKTMSQPLESEELPLKSPIENNSQYDENLETENKSELIPETLLKDAYLLYNEGDFAGAKANINLFLSCGPENYDEGLFLKGKILEAKSEIRDIKGAIDAYSTITKEYPASSYWEDANKRIIYLKRFYLEVR